MEKKFISICPICGYKIGFFQNKCPMCGTKRKCECGFCHELIDYDAKTCNFCGKKFTTNGINVAFLPILIMVLIFNVIIVARMPSMLESSIKKANNNSATTSHSAEKIRKTNVKNKDLYYEITFRENGEEIRINEMIPFSGLSSQEILDMRKKAVKTSPVFYDLKDYEPSRNVFDIADNTPWIGARQVACVGTEGPNYNIGIGGSRESLMILNPELILHPLIPTYFNNSYDKCDKSLYFIPSKVVYYKDLKTITTHIDMSSIVAKVGYRPYVYLETANPRDLGYNAIFATKYHNIGFSNVDDNIALSVSEPRGFWHKGYACGLPEGCNNYSPRDTRYEIIVQDIPAAIRVKLWKDTPLNTRQKADLTYEIVFE